jgi:hydroxymethylglutaryl-CoA reductase
MNFTKFPNIDFTALRNELNPETPALFGSLNAQQMIEHVSLIYDYVLSNNKVKVLTPADKIEKVKRAFLWSEGGFKRGITNEFTESLSFECNLANLALAIDEYEKRHLLVANAIIENAIIDKTHPIFGLLNIEEWTQFFTKHTWHHFNQFGLVK